MKVVPIVPDTAPSDAATSPEPDRAGFGRTLDDIAAALGGAQRAEDTFANGRGSLAQAVYERARADVVLSVAIAAAGRTTGALQSVLNMQV
jgi:flagellar hook-basal body complex protein FliE